MVKNQNKKRAEAEEEWFCVGACTRQASQVAQMAKNLLAMQETWVQSLGQEDPLEKGMAAHSSILAQSIPWTEVPGRLQSMGSQRVRHGGGTNTFTFTFSSTRQTALLTGTLGLPLCLHPLPCNFAVFSHYKWGSLSQSLTLCSISGCQ